MADINSILVIGAGELGTAILRALTSHRHFQRPGVSVSVLLRPSTISSTNEAKRAELSHLQSLNIALVPGDIIADTESQLSTIFAGFTTIVGASGMTSQSGTQTRIAKAVLAAGVRRYIPWQFGVDYDLIGHSGGGGMFSEQLSIRENLRSQSKTSWKIVSTGMFMSFIFENMFGVVKSEPGPHTGKMWTVNALGSWENKVTLTDVRDIGTCTAEVVYYWEDVRDEIVYLAGDTVTYQQLASSIEDVAGKKVVQRVEWTVPYLREEAAEDPDDGMKKYRVVFAEGTGLAWDEKTSFNAERGISTMNVHEGTKRYLRL